MTTLIPVIAIDGPSASGKGTVAARVAEILRFHCLDSGSLYRLVAFAAMRSGLALDDESELANIARTLPVQFVDNMTLFSGENVSLAIRSEACAAGASKVALFPAVREALLARQRAYCQPPGLVAEGRDMGSVVFPHAQTKIFLTASVEARAERRYKQLIDKGLPANIDKLLQDIRERDARDVSRQVAPLQQSPDATLLDTSSLTIDKTVELVLRCYL